MKCLSDRFLLCGLPVVIRTLDIGADKKPAYIELEKEEKPATDSKLTEWFIDIGLDELSVTPASILKLRQRIREMQ